MILKCRVPGAASGMMLGGRHVDALASTAMLLQPGPNHPGFAQYTTSYRRQQGC